MVTLRQRDPASSNGDNGQDGLSVMPHGADGWPAETRLRLHDFGFRECCLPPRSMPYDGTVTMQALPPTSDSTSLSAVPDLSLNADRLVIDGIFSASPAALKMISAMHMAVYWLLGTESQLVSKRL
jgi:hypothetical protein